MALNKIIRGDGTPKTVENEEVITWDEGKSYALARFAEGGQHFDLPCWEELVNGEKIREEKDILVFGERSGGGRAFLEWYRRLLGVNNNPWVLVQASDWKKENFAVSQVMDSSILDSIEAFGRVENPAEKANYLKTVAEKMSGKTIYLIIKDYMGLGRESAELGAAALRQFRDTSPYLNLHIMIMSTAEFAFLETAFRSRYNATCFRLPHLSTGEVRALAACGDASQPPLAMENKALDDLMLNTGGQPFLVRSFIDHFRETRKGDTPLKKSQVQKAWRRLVQSPPAVASIWQEDLENLLRVYPQLVPRMKIYAAVRTIGPAYFPPPSEERFLMIGGWTNLNAGGRWGITSRFHAYLARPVLDRL